MLKTDELRIVTLDIGTTKKSLSFSTADWDRLENFCTLVEEARQFSFVQRAPVTLPIICEQADNSSIQEEYTKESLAAALHVTRRIILQTEPYSFVNTLALIGKASKGDADIKTFSKKLGNQFNRGQLSNYMQIYSGSTPLLSDSAFRLWLNTKIYHQDLEKMAAFAEISNSIGANNTDRLFVSQFVQRIFAFLKLYGALGESIRKPSSSESLANG